MQFELTKEYLEDLRAAIARNEEISLLELVNELHPADVAEIIDELEVDEALVLYKVMDAQRASDVLMHLEDDSREEFLSLLTPKEIAEQFIDHLDSDDAADMIQELPEDQKEQVIAQIEDRQQARDIIDLLHYKEGTAGALMAKELIKVNVNWTVSQAVKEMRKQAEQLEHVYTVYVVDDDEKLLGRLKLNKLLLNPVRAKIDEIYDSKLRYVNVNEDQEEVASIMEKYDLVALPVVDELNRLQGRITIDDIVDVIKEEADKDYQLAAGLTQDVEADDSIIQLTKARLPWLFLGLLGGVGAFLIMQMFENTFSENAILFFFTPLIAAMAGNVGVQSSAIIVQGLANDDVKGSINSRLIKEMLLATLNGIVLALFLFLFVWLSVGNINTALAISVSLVAVVIVAGLIGTFVPLFLNKQGIDPAIATGPFITTSNDIFGILIYFMIAKIILGI